MIPLRTHNILDYVIGVLLILAPWLLGFNDINAATNVYLVLGVGLIVYSLFTNYKYSIARVIPLGIHMSFDAIAGIVLILAPSVFAYRGLLTTTQEAAHYLLGMGAVGLVLLTRPRTEQERHDIGHATAGGVQFRQT